MSVKFNCGGACSMTRNTKYWLASLVMALLWAISGKPSEACSFLAATLVIAAMNNRE